MNNKFPIRIFGLYDPCFSDIKLIQLDIAYKKSECYKIIMHEQVVYLREKWNYMRKFFEAESLIDDIEKVNDDFRCKWGLQQRKIYYDKNADRIRKQQMDFYYKNRETILEQERKYRQSHKEQINEKNKVYNQTHKDKINARRNAKITCVCGVTISKGYIHKHEKTMKHIQFL